MRLYLDTSVFNAYYDERAPERMELTIEFWTKLSGDERLCSELTTISIISLGFALLRFWLPRRS